MEFEKNRNGSKLTYYLNGNLDANSSPKLNDDINESIDDITELVFDFENLNYVSSSGLRVLLSAQKKMNKKGTMCIIHVSSTISEIFEVTGFANILSIE